MYLKQITAATNRGLVRSSVRKIIHDGVTLRLKSKRVNCHRYQTLEIIYLDKDNNLTRVGPCPLSTLGADPYVTQYGLLKSAIQRWLVQLGDTLPVNVELAVKSLVTRSIYSSQFSDMLRITYNETQYNCEKTRGVSLSPQRAMMVFPAIQGYHVRLDVRLKRKKYVTYFSITHPDRVMENAQGDTLPIVYTECRYGYILGARGLYSLLQGWYEHSLTPNADMLKAIGPELLDQINGERRRTIDEFFVIINGQVSTNTPIP